jgi:putative flippase GtrA
VATRTIAGGLRQFSSFALLGFLAAGIDFCIYIFLIGVGTDAIVGNLFSSTIGILINYLLVSKFTFNIDYRSSRNVVLFFLIATGMLLLMSLFLEFLINNLSWNPIAAKSLSLPISAVIKFLLNRRFTFV